MIVIKGETCEEQLESAIRMVELYKYDSMTGLKRRYDFDKSFEKYVHNNCDNNVFFSFALIDINGLHDLNHVSGMKAGDKLICDVAKELQTLIRNLGTVYRIGGDEFSILTDKIDRSELSSILEYSNLYEKFSFGVVDSSEINHFHDNQHDVFNYVDSLMLRQKQDRKLKRS